MTAARTIIDRYSNARDARASNICPERALWAAVLWRALLDLAIGTRNPTRTYRHDVLRTSRLARLRKASDYRAEAVVARQWFNEPGDPSVVGSLAYVCQTLDIPLQLIMTASQSSTKLRRLYQRQGRIY